MSKKEQIQTFVTQGVAFGPFIPNMRARGFGKTTSYKLLKLGLVETAMIGGRRFVRLASIDSLFDRFAAMENSHD